MLKNGSKTKEPKIAKWYPNHPPIYDIQKTYLENLKEGPFFQAEIPSRIFPPKEQWMDFLGQKVASPLGVPAGPLLSSQWIRLAAKLGFDIVTYKTIRSKAYPAHPLPNMIYVQSSENSFNDEKAPVIKIETPTSDLDHLSVTNSFGMPSMGPDFLAEDIRKANQLLQEGQTMVVSVVGTPEANKDFVQDFINVACFAKECGAKIIEANFSCPNIATSGGSLYLSPDSVFQVAQSIAKAIHPVPLIIKVGIFPNHDLLKQVMIAAARANVQGFSGINTIKRKVIDRYGNPGLDENRPYSGLCGGPIREKALAFTEKAFTINNKEKLGLTLIGVGGITLPEHFDTFLASGAKVVMSATGMMWDPYLAMRWHERKNQI